jgi:hypothetical protein
MAGNLRTMSGDTIKGKVHFNDRSRNWTVKRAK